MGIIVSQNGKNARKVQPSSFKDEDFLQKYIHNNPDCLPLEEIDEDIRLLVLAREFPTDSGPIDALGIDMEGTIYLVETKLYKNPDKRTVVAQVMDYGAALWRGYTNFLDFLDVLDDRSIKQTSKGLTDRITEFFGLNEEELDTLKAGLQQNLSNGRFRFVVLMDRLTDRLKDLILFINQNSQFDIYGVELEFYQHAQYEILIPRLFGAEVRKRDAGMAGKRGRWDKASVFAMLTENVQSAELAAVRKLYDHSAQDFEITWGTGIHRGSFNARSPNIKRAVFTVFTDGKLAVVADKMTPQEIERFLHTSSLGARGKAGGAFWMEFSIDKWAGKVDAIIKAIDEFVANRSLSGNVDKP